MSGLRGKKLKRQKHSQTLVLVLAEFRNLLPLYRRIFRLSQPSERTFPLELLKLHAILGHDFV